MELHEFLKGTGFWSCQIMIFFLCISCIDNERRSSEANTHTGTTERDSAYIVEVTAADYAFGMPTEIPSGWVTFRMNNLGQEAHNGIIYKYEDTLSYEELGKIISEALKEEQVTNRQHPFNTQIETPMGGPAILSPGLTGETTVLLEPGVYALTCWMVAEDGEFHVMKGMTRPFVVTEQRSGADKPEGTIDVTLEDVAIRIKDSITAGDHVFNVNFNTQENVHLARLEKGQDMEKLKEWMNKVQNPSPFTFLGGAEQAPVGMTNTFKARLEPGRYALVTYGSAVNGMTAEIIVPETGKAAPVSNEPVNPPVTIKFTPEGVDMPQELKTGRTAVTLAATGEKQGYYVLSRLKKGSTVQEFKKFTEDAYVYQRVNPELAPPSHNVWFGTLGSNDEVKLNLDIQNATYVLTGPLPPEGELLEQWKGDDMFHSFKAGEGQTEMVR